MAVRGRRNMLAQTLASRRLPEGVAEPGERVPDALAPEVMPFIRAADEVEPFNPRVAFLCKSRDPHYMTWNVTEQRLVEILEFLCSVFVLISIPVWSTT
jgi:hypothetical protein